MSADEDIFASLGGSLMSGLLSDLNQTTATATSASASANPTHGQDDNMDALASLERDLAGLTSGGAGGTGAVGASGISGPGQGQSAQPQPQPPGMATLSAASMVVSGLGAPTSAPPPSAAGPPPATSAAGTASTSTSTGISGDDAWALSLAKFSSLQGLADDFVKADAAKKASNSNSNPPSAPPSAPVSGNALQLPPGGDLSSAMVDNLLFDDDDDEDGTGGGGGYDIEEKVTLGSTAAIGGIDLGAMRTKAVQQAKAQAAQAQQAQVQAAQQGPPPPPSQMMPGMNPAAQQQMMMHQQQQQQAQQQAMMMMTQQQQQAQQQAAAYARHMEQQAAVAGMEQRRQLEFIARQKAREEKKMAAAMAMKAKKGGTSRVAPPAKQQEQQQQPVAFLKKDFPTLGGGGGVGGAGNDDDGPNPTSNKDAVVAEEDGNEPLISAPPPAANHISPSKIPTGIVGTDTLAPRGAAGAAAAGARPPSMPVVPISAARLLFCNPTPSAPPINANNVQSYFMTPRDLCYVVHSMMRPLISLDAYNDDFYRWSYDDRRNRNLLVLGGSTPQGNNLPNPVWKETKEKAQAIEDKYRGNVEKRAEKWSTKQQTLGKTVKVNVKRPKALLATTGALTTATAAGGAGADDDEREDRSEEDRQRVSMWSARLAIDRGYVAYLDLLETRRLLQTSAGLEASVAERRAELTRDVEANVAKLHGSLGVTVSTTSTGGGDGGGGEAAAQRTIEVDSAVLARTLGMPKGRMLLSRVLDDGVLPHSSACRVLPKALGVILSTAVPAGAPPRGEDRLVRSLTGLVQTSQPSLAPEDLIDSLVEFGSVYQSELQAKGTSPGDTVRNMLGTSGGQRARMELLHAILSRGGMVCGGSGPDVAGAWKAKEAEFMTILSAMNSA